LTCGLRTNTLLFQQPSLLLDQPRGAGRVLDLPPALIVINPGRRQVVVVAAQAKGRARPLEGLHDGAGPGVLITGRGALARILAHHAEDGQPVADGPLGERDNKARVLPVSTVDHGHCYTSEAVIVHPYINAKSTPVGALCVATLPVCCTKSGLYAPVTYLQ
jgi:hypothetical protein